MVNYLQDCGGVDYLLALVQQRLNNALESQKDILLIHNDVLVFGKGCTKEQALEDHERNFNALLLRCCQQNVKLSFHNRMSNASLRDANPNQCSR